MGEMNRATAGHGSGGPLFKSGVKKQSRLSSLAEGIAGAQNQKLQNEHEIHKMVTKHVLAKDMHTHIYKGAERGTPVTMDYEGIKTGIVKKQRKVKGAESIAPAEHVETPASTPQAAEAESTPRAEHHSGNATFVGGTIPTHPGTWEGGWMERGPKGVMRTKPGYKEFKTRTQHFEAGIASQQGHFAVKPGIKIPNYAKKAMQPKKGK